ncbi:fungal-specific transcription factor domain-containing protein [Paraphoma chrysanthemicola]|uniref:Fungal-specific transcription factor domain-containing protein n=1 Tax=Paraphoma chrysanthemicola TaxID=798071 RepID=A0A8K0VX04_9PLEO|nr:fungal-specific transcription factor domain-containing protein [Paraphoma chrysanthemicola]
MTEVTTNEATIAQPQLLSRRACESCHKKKTKCDRKLPICSLCDRTSTICEFPSKRKRSAQSLQPWRKPPKRAADNDVDWLFPLFENDPLAAPSTDQTSPNFTGFFTVGDTLDYMAVRQSQNLDLPSQQRAHSSARDLVDFTPSNLLLEHTSLPPPPTYSGSSDGNSSKSDSPRNYSRSTSLFTHLMDLFFDNVQPWLPILHKTRFFRRYGDRLNNVDPFKDLASDEALLLSTAFSLAARFSSHDLLAHTPAVDRGQDFFETASDYLSKCRALTSPTLAYLQGSIMYSFYSYNRGVFLQGWIHTAVCIQLAYELGLDSMDDEDSNAVQYKTWSEKEEMRRAWWLVWELDTFGSIVSSRPSMIDCTRMSVFLPVSDEQWFSDVEMTSARLLTNPGTCWKSLDHSENQSARAWFLVANHLQSLIQTSRQRKDGISPEMQIRLENDISCTKLAFPPSMLLDTDRANSGAADKHDKNWVIGTHIMLLSASWYMRGIDARTTGESPLPNSFAFEKARILSKWRQEEIAIAHPFFTLLLVNAFSDHHDGQAVDSMSLSSCRDLSRLLLRQFSFKWNIGLVALRVDEIWEHVDASTSPDEQMIKRYSTCFVTQSPKSSNLSGSI